MGNTRRTRTHRTPAPPDTQPPGTNALEATSKASSGQATSGDPSTRDGPWTIDRIQALGATTDLRTAAAIFGISKNTAYELLHRGQFPVAVLRVGGRYRIPVPAILTVLGAWRATTDTQPPARSER